MSSTRNSLTIKSGVRKMHSSPFQASDAEIQSDLSKLEYISSKKKEETLRIPEAKIKKTQEELTDSNAIEMLAKLQSFTKAEKDQVVNKRLAEKKIISNENRNYYNGHIEYPLNYDINYQNYVSNMVLMSNLNMLQYYQMNLNQSNFSYYNYS